MKPLLFELFNTFNDLSKTRSPSIHFSIVKIISQILTCYDHLFTTNSAIDQILSIAFKILSFYAPQLSDSSLNDNLKNIDQLSIDVITEIALIFSKLIGDIKVVGDTKKRVLSVLFFVLVCKLILI